MNTIKFYILLFLFGLLSWPFAGNAQNGIFIAGELGYANQPGLPGASTVGASQRSSPSFPSAYRGSIGYNHDIWSWLGFALEFGLGRYGETNYTMPTGTVHMLTTTSEFLTVTTFHLKPKWDIFVRAGGIRNNTFARGALNNSGQTRIQPEVGIGSAYQLSRYFALTASYAHTIGKTLSTLNGSEFKAPSLNEALLGLQFTFAY